MRTSATGEPEISVRTRPRTVIAAVIEQFHSTTCPFYRMSEDTGYDRHFVPTVKDYADKGVVFLGVNANRTESIDDIKKYIDKHSINYAVLKDEGNVVAD